MISKNQICDITKSWRFFGITYIYHKTDLVYKISGLFFDITESIL